VWLGGHRLQLRPDLSRLRPTAADTCCCVGYHKCLLGLLCLLGPLFNLY
jgi:hypothetical protein